MIQVSSDPSRKLVVAAMSGFLDVAEVARFAREEQDAVRAMGLKSGEFMLLVYTSECVIQSQEVVAAFQDVIRTAPLKSRRIAIVRQGTMTRMQTNRIIGVREEAAVFSDGMSAEAWLFGA